MEKVKLTREQAAQVEDIITERSVWTNLMDLSREELGAALAGEYELIAEPPKFIPGDYVVRKDGHPLHGNKYIGLIDRKVKFSYESVAVEGATQASHIHRSKLRHATLEEIYWMATLRRKKVGEFLYTDVLVDGDGDAHLLNGVHPSDGRRSLEDAEYWYGTGFFKGIYPAESFKPFPMGADK